MSHRDYMVLALEEAKKAAEAGDVPIGAVIVKKGKLIATGHNMKEVENDPTAHAEIIAIRNAAKELGSWRLAGCSLYVTLEPCPMCAGAIVLARLETLVFGASDSIWGGVGSIFNIPENSNANHKTEVISGIMEAECSLLLKTYFANKR